MDSRTSTTTRTWAWVQVLSTDSGRPASSTSPTAVTWACRVWSRSITASAVPTFDDRAYWSMTSPVAPMVLISPLSSQTAVLQRRATDSMLWLMKTTVRPLRPISLILPRHRRWNSASPTASTSSTRRMSASRWAAMAKPSRRYMPDE